MINVDLPIKSAAEDKLNRSAFANSLAKVLLDYSAPHSFSIGLYGKWGSGKTSLLNMVLETVEENNKDAVIIKFNPWLCSDSNQLIKQFFKQMAAAIKMKKPKGDCIWELIDQYGDIFDATSIIPVAGNAIAAFGRAVTLKANRHVNQRTEDLQGNKNRIVEQLKKSNTKMIVAIDDIDRLTEEEIVAVFQLVKALADFPNTVYLLAFDYHVVIKALSKVQHGDGQEYLEKIIQVPFKIPAPNMQNIQETLFSKLTEIIGDIPEQQWDESVWYEMYQYGIKEYVRSIRDVILYVNVFYLKYSLLKEETNPVDLLGLTCLQVFEPLLYSKLPHYKKFLCGGVAVCFSQQQEKEEQEALSNAINELFLDNVKNESAAKQILNVLFPKANYAIKRLYFSGRQYVRGEFLLSNKIAEPACFDRYFSLTLEDEAIPTAMIKQLILDASEKQFRDTSETLYKQGKIIRLVEEIEAYAANNEANAITSERAKLIMKCLAQQWHTFEVKKVDFLAIPFAWRFRNCADSLLPIISENDRSAFITELFENQAVQPSTLSLMLQNFEATHGRFNDNTTRKDTPLLSLEEVINLESVFKKRVIEILDSRKILDEYNGLNCLWMLENIDPELAKKKKRVLVTGAYSLIKVLGYCFTQGVTTTGRTSQTMWHLHKKSLTEFVDVQTAFDLIDTFVNTDDFLSCCITDQRNAVALLLCMEKTCPEQGDYYISEKEINRKLKEIVDQ